MATPGGLTEDDLVQEILDSGRSFLWGLACDEVELRANLQKPILVGGLSPEERLLMLSVLPSGTEHIELREMDKGLSGSKVFEARVQRHGQMTKPFVIKVGPLTKIEREAAALAEIVAPTIMGIGPPIHRPGHDLGVVVQDLASLTEHARLDSLRTRVRTTELGPSLVSRVVAERLRPWYLGTGLGRRRFVLRQLFKHYLSKAPTFGLDFPPQWDDLFAWVESESGCSWGLVEEAVSTAKATECNLPETIVHGDLHTQNIIVDENNECWPIDFGWTTKGSSCLVDLLMLECSLKFLVLPMRSELRPLLKIETALSEFSTRPTLARVPYSDEAERVFSTVERVRDFALGELDISPKDYVAGLLLMTYAMASHPDLNTPYVLASLQINAGAFRKVA